MGPPTPRTSSPTSPRTASWSSPPTRPAPPFSITTLRSIRSKHWAIIYGIHRYCLLFADLHTYKCQKESISHKLIVFVAIPVVITISLIVCYLNHYYLDLHQN